MEGYSFLTGCSVTQVMARQAGADLKIVDIGLKRDISDIPGIIQRKVAYGSEDYAKGLAMTEQQASQAIMVGINTAKELAQNGYTVLALAEMGLESQLCGAAIASFLLNNSRELNKGLEGNHCCRQAGIEVLSKIGGYDIAGMTGLILGAAASKIPVVIDGIASTAAALVAAQIEPLSIQYILPSQVSIEPCHQKMLTYLKLEPILDLGLKLGEGTGSILGLTILDAAIHLYQEMATLAETLEEAGNCQ